MFVDSLFEGYERTGPLVEFMEELTGNLEDKVANDMEKGMSREAAFRKARAELGDISALAAELSLKARQDLFAERYLRIRSYMTAPRVAAYVACGALLAFGLVTAAIVYFTREEYRGYGALTGAMERMSGVFGALLIFITAAASGFTFLGLTQETAELRPMKKKRAALYACAAGLVAFGLVLFPLTYFATGRGMMEAIATLIPFTLPGAGVIAFLVLTERERLKPWVAGRTAAEIRQSRESFADVDARFGLFAGAIWIFAFGAFVALGFVIGFRYSWLSFVFAAAIQLAAQGALMKKSAGAGSEAAEDSVPKGSPF
jgi:hypothetical protein